MMRLKVFSGDPEKWHDVARRCRHVELVDVATSSRPLAGPAADIALFDGAVEAHPEAIEKAMAAGMHVLVAAPPCLPLDVPSRLLKRAQESRRTFACENPDRLLPSRLSIKNLLRRELGTPELVRIHRRLAHSLADATAPLGLPSDLVGEIEQAIWLVARPLRGVFAVESQIADDDRPGRSILVHLSFDQGMAVIDYDDRLPAGNHPAGASYRFLSVIGSTGSAQVDDHRNSQLLFIGGAPRALVVDDGVRHLAGLVDSFAYCYENEIPFPHGAELWSAMPSIIDAVLRSLKTRDVALPEGL